MASRRDFLASVIALPWAVPQTSLRQIALQIILVRSRAEANLILQKLQERAPFALLAKRYSVDPSADDGGFIGKTKLSELRPELRAAVVKLREGQCTGIVDTPRGYMILKLLPQAVAERLEEILRPHTPKPLSPLDYTLVTSVIGDSEVARFLKSYPKPADYAQNLQANCKINAQAAQWGIRQLRTALESAARQGSGPGEAGRAKMFAQYQLGQMLSFQGDMDGGIDFFRTAYQTAHAFGEEYYQRAFEKVLGIAELRRAQVRNWLEHHNAHSSIFPISREAYFALPSSAEAAIQHFQSYLDHEPQDLEEKWLLNVAYMALGKYPSAVPSEHLVPLSAFSSSETSPRFVDVASTVGLDILNTAGGVIMDDFDNDGCLDLMVSGMEACTPLKYFHNEGDGRFSDRTVQAGLASQLGGLNLVQTDYNNDGWLDAYVMRGAWSMAVRNSLLRNNGNGTFTDVTSQAGLAIPATSTQAAAWGDFDNDGLLDLFVGNEGRPSQLFHNNGDGTFTDVARIAGVDRVAFTKSAVWGDYDNDGLLDLYVSNYRGENFLYHNNGDGTFTEVAGELHVQKPLLSFGAWFFDFDNDGWLDLFVTSYIVSVSENLRSYLGQPVNVETARLYRNNKGRFEDVTREVGLDRVFMPMGANFGDMDNDGYLDIYLGTGSPSYASIVPNVLLKNLGGNRFADVTAASGTGSLQKGHGVAIGDIFNDGEPAIFAQLGGMAPGDRYYSALFRNQGTGNNWVSIKLVGVKSNRCGIGARIKVTVKGEGGRPRHIYRDVNSGGSFGASPLRQLMGIGRANRIEELEVHWPASRTRQAFRNLSSNQFIEVKEFAGSYRRLNLRPEGNPPT